MTLHAHALAGDDRWLEFARERLQKLRLLVEDLESSGDADEPALEALRSILERYEGSGDAARRLETAA